MNCIGLSRPMKNIHSDNEIKFSGNKSMALDRKPLLCPMCNFACYNDTELEQHFEIHSNENSISNITISQVKSHVSETFYACQLCDFMSAGEEQLEDHYENKHPFGKGSQKTIPPQSVNIDSKEDPSLVELSVMPPVSQNLPVISSPLYACTFCGLLGSSLESVQVHYQNQHLDLFQTLLLQQGVNRPTMTQPSLSSENARRKILPQPSTFPTIKPAIPPNGLTPRKIRPQPFRLATIRPAIPPEIRNIKLPGSQTLTNLPCSSSPVFLSQPSLSRPRKIASSAIAPLKDTSSILNSSPALIYGNFQDFEQLDKSISPSNNTSEPVTSLEIPVPKVVNIYFCGLCNTKMNSLEDAYDHMAKYHGNSQTSTSNEVLHQNIIPSNLNKFDFKDRNQKLILEKNDLKSIDTGNCIKTENVSQVAKTIPIENIKNEFISQYEDIQIATETTSNSETTVKDSLQLSANVQLVCTKKELLNDLEMPRSSKHETESNLDLLFSCDVCGYVDKKIKFMKAHLRDNHELGSWRAMEVKFLNSEEVKDAEKRFRLKGHYKSSRESGCRELGFLCQACSFYTNSRTRISMHNVYVHREEGSYHYVEIKILLLNKSQHLKNNAKISASDSAPPSNESELKNLDNSALKCQECTEDFLSPVELQRHLITINHILRCHFCSFSTKIPNALAHHNYRKHAISLPESLAEKAHNCPHCPYISPLYYKVINHIRFQHKDRHKYHCDSCSKTFATLIQYDDHYLVHKQLGLFPCSHCSYGALNESLLKRHIQLKHCFEKSYRFRCPFCDYQSAVRYNFIRHLKRQHSNLVEGLATITSLVIKDTPMINQQNSDISNISVSKSVNDTELPMEMTTEEPVMEGFDSDETDELNDELDSEDDFL